MKDNQEELEKDTYELCDLKIKLSKLNKTKPWTIEELKDVTKQLQKGYANEIFKENVAYKYK